MLDVVILGGGFAGISAALRLQAAGLDFEIIEAKDRLGGRVLAAPATDIELGAEFVHGCPPATAAFLKEAGIGLHEVRDTHDFLSPEGVLRREPKFWEQLDSVMSLLRSDIEHDRSFDEFLGTLRRTGDPSPESIRLARAFVEGFNASEADDASEKSLALAWRSFGASEEMRAFHPSGGYSALLSRLARRIPHGRVMLESRARSVRWQQGSAVIEAENVRDGSRFHVQARTVLITLPVGVLQAPPHAQGALEILPVLPELKAAIDGVRMGSVAKVSLVFHGLPERVERRWSEISFVHRDLFGHGQPGRPGFQTWWTRTDLDRRVLSCWSTAEAARSLLGQPPSSILHFALESAAEVLAASALELQASLKSWHFHDWENDPYCRGAYSFVVQGGVELQRRLCEPFAGGVILLAGEACARESDLGTVEAAIESGQSAASRVLERYRISRAA